MIVKATESGTGDAETRARIVEHWAASEIADIDTGSATHSVSIMEFSGGLVAHETQYFADPFPAPGSRAALADRIPDSGE